VYIILPLLWCSVLPKEHKQQTKHIHFTTDFSVANNLFAFGKSEGYLAMEQTIASN